MPTKVILHVYDLIPHNDYGYQFGVGAYHSGVELNGVEWSFGGHPDATSGVFTCEPKRAYGVKYRESIVMGDTSKTTSEIQRIIDDLSAQFLGNTYNIFSRNCNHFSEELCQVLLKKSIPGYINRLAWYGGLFQCFLPPNLGVQPPNSANSTMTTPVSTPSYTAFSGTGFQLNSQQQQPPQTTSVTEEDPNARRERMAAAALKRFENKQ